MPAAHKIQCARCERKETKKSAKAGGWVRVAGQWLCLGCRSYGVRKEGQCAT
jgi:hypothetical protein